MGRPTSEAGVVQSIIKAVLRAYPDTWQIKVHGGPYQEAGVPDLLVCIPPYGVLVGLEVKFQRPGESAEHARGRATPGQRSMIARIIRAGGTAGVVLDAEEALALIESAIEKWKEVSR